MPTLACACMCVCLLCAGVSVNAPQLHVVFVVCMCERECTTVIQLAPPGQHLPYGILLDPMCILTYMYISKCVSHMYIYSAVLVYLLSIFTRTVSKFYWSRSVGIGGLT